MSDRVSPSNYKFRELMEVRVTDSVQPLKKRRRRYTPKPHLSMPDPEVTERDLARMPAAMRKAVLAACQGNLYRLSRESDGSIYVHNHERR